LTSPRRKVCGSSVASSGATTRTSAAALVAVDGFSKVTVKGLAPLDLVQGQVSDALKPIVDRFNMGQDYAAIGYKL